MRFRLLVPALFLATLPLAGCGSSGGGNGSGGSDSVQVVNDAAANDTGFVGPDGKPISEDQLMNQIESNTSAGGDAGGNSAQ